MLVVVSQRLLCMFGLTCEELRFCAITASFPRIFRPENDHSVHESHRLVHDCSKALRFAMLPTSHGWELRHLLTEFLSFLDCRYQVAERLISNTSAAVERSDTPDISTNKVVRPFHGHGQLFLMVVEKAGIGHDNQRYLIPQSFQDGTRSYPC